MYTVDFRTSGPPRWIGKRTDSVIWFPDGLEELVSIFDVLVEVPGKG
jgi:hypothetical protein